VERPQVSIQTCAPIKLRHFEEWSFRLGISLRFASLRRWHRDGRRSTGYTGGQWGISCGMARSPGFSDDAGLPPIRSRQKRGQARSITRVMHPLSVNPLVSSVSGLCTEAQMGECIFLPDCWMVCAVVDGQGSGRLPGTSSGSGPCIYTPATSRIPVEPVPAPAESICRASSVPFSPAPWLLGECIPFTFTRMGSLAKPWSR